ncbi:uncharacterized protein LY79DRAFT_266540 [Colletotrichum navitas]|uniref:Uncharacterized protein n=1 Tax=Colletotrichum navitas TaxID=681940 RepID=A0AAD8V462_9PEZI|nr:uncharacterized protein LY79DRAFT_266540 [Colletotrichum navitas]KAK1585580.1 hypothetical protein LY79DRAFT_266540 [Colletotrichum navitas]
MTAERSGETFPLASSSRGPSEAGADSSRGADPDVLDGMTLNLHLVDIDSMLSTPAGELGRLLPAASQQNLLTNCQTRPPSLVPPLDPSQVIDRAPVILLRLFLSETVRAAYHKSSTLRSPSPGGDWMNSFLAHEHLHACLLFSLPCGRHANARFRRTVKPRRGVPHQLAHHWVLRGCQGASPDGRNANVLPIDALAFPSGLPRGRRHLRGCETRRRPRERRERGS